MRSIVLTIVPLVALAVACSSTGSRAGDVASAKDDAGLASPGPVDAGGAAPSAEDAGNSASDDSGGFADTGVDGADAAVGCSVDGDLGTCITVTACAALTGYTSTPGYCPGAADIECCAPTPNVADNPPIPAGYQLMAQADVTAAMTTWAVSILNDPTDYPMFSTATQTFGTQLVLARVEWHPPDFQNSVVHRGVTLYEPT
jgi:hypothetical protein